MQKHLLALAAGVATLAFSTAAFADNNKSYTRQEGNGNELSVEQQGSGNLAGLSEGEVIYQNGTGMTAGNTLVIRQIGNYNQVGRYNNPPTGGSTSIDANQTGANNSLAIDQLGESNSVAYRQFGNYNGRQPSGAAPDSARAFNPADNYGIQGSRPTGSWNYVNQTGFGGNVKIDQDSRNSASSNGVIALQSGNAGYQFIDLTQTTTGSSQIFADNLAYFDQRSNGINVTAKVNQTNNGATYNLTDIRQAGSNVSANVIQVGSGLDLLVDQVGDNNSVTSTQTARNSKILARQNSSGSGGTAINTITANQTNGEGHLLDATQVGYGHIIVSNQGNGDFNSAIVNQSGSFNTYIGSQQGTLNRADVLQGASLNQAYVTQNGTSNVATITQNRTR